MEFLIFYVCSQTPHGKGSWEDMAGALGFLHRSTHFDKEN